MQSLRKERTLRPQLEEKEGRQRQQVYCRPQQAKKNKESSNGKAASNVGAEHKWCSAHKNCLARRHGMLQARSAKPTAEWTRSRCLCCTRREHKPQRRRKSVPQLRRWFEERFAFTGLLAGSGNRRFHHNSDKFTMLVDSGASDHLIDEELIPRLRKSMRDNKKLKESKTILTNGKILFAKATGTMWGYIIYQAGKRVPV